VLSARDIYKGFDGAQVLRGMSLEVNKGEVVALIGPSGSGKSTFLRCLNRLETIDRGEITLDGETLVTTQTGGAVYAKDAQRMLRKMGMVFQSFNLFPHFSVTRNLTEAQVVVRGASKEAARARAIETLRRVGLLEKADQYPYQLSGGQAQRVAIARALCMEPKLLCFDEPTSALDPELTQEVLAVMRDLARDHMTMIVVTHEMAFARDVADRMVLMEDGLELESGTPEQVYSSDNPRVRRFLGVE